MLVDFHAHILPRVDHGSESLEESLEQLRILQSFDVNTVVATPHFYPNAHTVDAFVEQRDDALRSLLASAPAERPRICLGAEVLLCAGLHKMQGLDRLCIRGTHCLLAEMPTDVWYDDLMETVEELLHRGFDVVLAHIDRYPNQWNRLDVLLHMGAKAQINAAGLSNIFSRRSLLPYWKQGSVVALGSDLHGIDPVPVKHLRRLSRRLDGFDEVMKQSAFLLENAEKY